MPRESKRSSQKARRTDYNLNQHFKFLYRSWRGTRWRPGRRNGRWSGNVIKMKPYLVGLLFFAVFIFPSMSDLGHWIDPKTKYRLFLLKPYGQTLRWYFYFTGCYLQIISLLFIVYRLAQDFLHTKAVLLLRWSLYYTCFMFLNYWLWRYDLKVELHISGALISFLYVYYYKPQRYGN